MVQPSAYEQYMLELINRARLDPSGEANRYEIDLNENLNPNTISDSPKQPLAFNLLLTDAANFHSQWMLNTDTFSHTGAGGSSAGDRITDAGYQFSTWGENIGYKGTTGTLDINSAVAEVHQSLFKSSGHRQNILKENFREIGLATLTGDYKGYNSLMATQNFATAPNSSPFLTGVVFNDAVNDDDFYTVGEGLADREIVAVRQSDNSSFATNTMTSGGYQLALEPGVYDVQFLTNNQSVTSQITIDSTNIKLDLNTENLESLDVGNFLEGSADNDFIQGLGGDDTIYGGLGNDTLEGNEDSDRLYAGEGNDLVSGGSGDDYLYLGIDNDFATGDDGNDYIQGEWGEDTISGGAGADTLQGNQNSDTFVYNLPSDSSIAQPDTIVDFTVGSDKLQLNMPDFAPNNLGTVNYINEANAYFVDTSSQLAFSAAESILYIDFFADGTADMAIELENVTSLNLSDLM